MIILFSPSESKTQLDGYSSICKESFIFQDQYAKRIEAVKIYNEYINSNSIDSLLDIFGIKDIEKIQEYQKNIFEAATCPAIKRYSGVVRILQIYIRNHVQLSVPEAEVETEVILVGGFPRQFVVSHTGDRHTAIIAVVDATGHQRLPGIVADSILISGLSITQAELQVCLREFPERFF